MASWWNGRRPRLPTVVMTSEATTPQSSSSSEWPCGPGVSLTRDRRVTGERERISDVWPCIARMLREELWVWQMHQAVRLDEKLHLIAVDEARELVQGNLTGGLNRPIRTQQAAHHIHRHAKGKRIPKSKQPQSPSQLQTCTHSPTSAQAKRQRQDQMHSTIQHAHFGATRRRTSRRR